MNRTSSALPYKTALNHHFSTVIVALIFALICVCSCAIFSLPPHTALAATSNSDPNEACSLTIESTYDQQPLPGMSVSLYKVATFSEENWSYTSNFSTCNLSLQGLEKASEWDATAKQLKDWVLAHSVSSIADATTSSNGEAFFDSLSQGLYLVSDATITLEGKTYTQAPFLVALPSTNEISGAAVYDVVSEPKTEQNDSSISDNSSEVASTNTTSTGTNSTDSSKKTGDYTFLLIAGITLLIVVCIVVLVITRRKK